MELRIQLVATAGSLILLGIILELVRRRRLLERYALLWLFSATVLLALAAWKGLLSDVASAIGVFYPPSALFLIAFGFVLVLLLHFSVAVSRLTDQSKVMAQRMALLEDRLRQYERREAEAGGEPDAPGARRRALETGPESRPAPPPAAAPIPADREA